MTDLDSKARSGRSNSLQRMLELEKQYMFERLHPHSQTQAAPSNTNSQPSSATTVAKNSPVRSSIQVRRAEGNTQKAQRKSNESRRDTSMPPQLPPLIINTGAPITMSRSDLFASQGRDYSPMDGSSTAVATPSDKYPKVVSFEFPPTESAPAPAPCHSPSWEAYERRKTEKKTEKREREESRHGRTKRLVKPPPASSPYALQQAVASEIDATRGRRRERADSSTALNSPNKPPRKARSRSGSFVSLLRAPFEFRRSSVDTAADSGFIGGIKLELQRHAATQQALDSQAVEDESNIHPALRKGKQNQRWSTPLKSPPPPARPGVDGLDAQRRYPPITRGKNHHKTMSLVSPTAPAVPDLSTIDRWRAKVGLKTGPRPDSRLSPDHDAHLDGASAAASLKSRISGPREIKPSENQARTVSLSPPQPTHIAFATGSPPRGMTIGNKPKAEHGNNVSISSCSTGETYTTAPSSPPPPEPPRRSSKRNSVLSLDESIPPLPSPHHHNSSIQSSPVQESPPRRSFPLCRDGAQAKRGSNDRTAPMEVTIRQPSVYVSSPGSSHLPGSSSEDSGSEDFHSTSIVSTPATSRPQSEKGMSLDNAPKDERSMSPDQNGKRRLTVPNTTYPLHSTENSDDEGMDPIQAAAEKVLAVFNGIPIQQPCLRRRSNSQSTLATDVSVPASLKERPLKLRPKNKSGVPLQGPASPASYLEEARKQPPAGVPHRAHKQRLGPPPSFIIPDSDSDVTATEQTPVSVPDIVGRSLRHKSTPLLSMVDREPITKVFVECCSCRYYHDMPSNLYEAMANPEGVLNPIDKCGFSGALSMTVKCSWCRHEMSTRCCAGLAATVYIKERLH